MSASIHFKGLLAGLAAVAIAGSAIAQSTPPNPAAKDPAVGAGQQSSQTTPMGSTGTPSGGSTAASPSTSGSTTAGSTGSATTSSGSTSMGASGSASTDTSASTSGSRTARADRN